MEKRGKYQEILHTTHQKNVFPKETLIKWELFIFTTNTDTDTYEHPSYTRTNNHHPLVIIFRGTGTFFIGIGMIRFSQKIIKLPSSWMTPPSIFTN